jgi:hypothetical protein
MFIVTIFLPICTQFMVMKRTAIKVRELDLGAKNNETQGLCEQHWELGAGEQPVETWEPQKK